MSVPIPSPNAVLAPDAVVAPVPPSSKPINSAAWSSANPIALPLLS